MSDEVISNKKPLMFEVSGFAFFHEGQMLFLERQ
jgi:hypothetical protein